MVRPRHKQYRDVFLSFGKTPLPALVGFGQARHDAHHLQCASLRYLIDFIQLFFRRDPLFDFRRGVAVQLHQ